MNGIFVRRQKIPPESIRGPALFNFLFVPIVKKMMRPSGHGPALIGRRPKYFFTKIYRKLS